MAIQYDIIVKGSLIHVVTTGYDESLSEVEAYGRAVMAACNEHQCTHILADERGLDYRLGTLDTYELAKYYAELVPSLIKIAIVCSPDDLHDAQFWETASRNRGLTVRVFTEIDEARRWLGLDHV